MEYQLDNMTLADLIQSQVNSDIEKLESQYAVEFQDIKAHWNSQLAEVKRLHSQEIDEAISTQINFKKFQQSKSQKFAYGYSVQAELDTIYQEILPNILDSQFVKNLITDTLKDIPSSSTLELSGQYSSELESLIKPFGYTITHSNHSENLGTISTILESGHLEITVEDILAIVKHKTLPLIIKQL